MSDEKVIINFKRHAYLLELEKAMKKKSVVRLCREMEGLYMGDPHYTHTLTFHDPTEVQEKLVEEIKDLERQLTNSEKKLKQAKKNEEWKDKLLRETREGLEEIQKEANKGPWKTFKNYVLGRDSE